MTPNPTDAAPAGSLGADLGLAEDDAPDVSGATGLPVHDGVSLDDTQLKLASIAATIAVVAVGEIPVGGTIASLILDLASQALLDQLSTTKSEGVDWESIRPQVQVEIAREHVREAVVGARSDLGDRQTQIDHLLRTHQFSDHHDYLSDLRTQIALTEDVVAGTMPADPTTAFHTLPYFMTLASLHLGLLRLQANELQAATDALDGGRRWTRRSSRRGPGPVQPRTTRRRNTGTGSTGTSPTHG